MSDTETASDESIEREKPPAKVDGRAKPRSDKQLENLSKAQLAKQAKDAKRREARELEKAKDRFDRLLKLWDDVGVDVLTPPEAREARVVRPPPPPDKIVKKRRPAPVADPEPEVPEPVERQRRAAPVAPKLSIRFC